MMCTFIKIMKGNQRKFHKLLKDTIERADVVVEVVDARFIDETRNIDIEEVIVKKEKVLILAINKCDLVSKNFLEKEKKRLKKQINHVVFLSAHKHLGTTILKRLIIKSGFDLLESRGEDRIDTVRASVIGYPNSGKSSVINSLSGRKKAKTSSKSGYTVGLQNARASKKLLMIDTPGVIPYDDKDEFKLALVASVEPSKLKDPDFIAEKIILKFTEQIVKYYDIKDDVEDMKDSEEILEKIAFKLKKLKKGGFADVKIAGRKMLTDWQQGKILLNK